MQAVKIVPRNKLPRNQQGVFFYSPSNFKELQRGQVVLVNFRKKAVNGILIDIFEKKDENFDFKLKPILYCYGGLILPSFSLALLGWMSDYYFTSLASLLRLFLPIPPKKEREDAKHPILLGMGSLFNTLTIPLRDVSTLKSFLSESSGERLFIGGSLKVKIALYIKLIQKHIARKEQVLFLTPTISSLNTIVSMLPDDWKEKTVIFEKTSAQSMHVIFDAWKKILNGSAKIIIGTRIACFAPFQNLRLIIMHDESAEEYKQYDQNPYYDVHRVVKSMINNSQKLDIVFTSNAPRLDTYLERSQRIFFWNEKENAKIRAVNMEIEVMNKNFSGISFALKEAMDKALNDGRKAIIYLNRKGFARKIVCRRCSHIFKCNACGRSLSVILEKERYVAVCAFCNARGSFPPSCAICGSEDMRGAGAGIQKIESVLKKLFPSVPFAWAEEEHNGEEAFIILGTKKLWNTKRDNIGIIAIQNGDTDLYLPHFQAHEEAFRAILLAKEYASLCAAPKTPIDVIVQTENPSHPAIACAVKGAYREFYEQELRIRREFQYPPFASFIRLIHQNKIQDNAELSARDLYSSLIILKSGNINIFPPRQMFEKTARENYRYYILIKFIGEAEIPSDMRRILLNLDASWVIDRDPLRLL